MDEANMRARAREVLAQGVEAVTHDGRGNIIRNVADGDLSWMQAACIRAMITFATTIAEEARAEERERCARIADPPQMHRKGRVGLWRQRRANIAAKIRNQTTTGNNEEGV